jgi:C4-type Zn-finger protein
LKCWTYEKGKTPEKKYDCPVCEEGLVYFNERFPLNELLFKTCPHCKGTMKLTIEELLEI